ncbi:MAG: DUF1631 family protein, partial [Gammaproteobacteria bacterium]|nr:DUF1631 family protein [Gammaproteobacteria bacterium]
PNLILVGRMFDAFYEDKRLPEELKGLLARLQYPVMKTALADPGFFRNPEHPVRVLVHDVFEMLAGADAPGADDLRRVGDLIDSLRREFEVDPSRLGQPEARAPAVGEADGAAFLEQQEKRMAGHRSRTLEKVRRLVAQELRLRTAARDIPRSAMPLLLSGFGPMLAVQFLRGGMSGGGWSAAVELLDRLLDSLDRADGLSATERAVRETEIIAGVKQQLESVGVAEDKIQRLLAGLADAYRARTESSTSQPVAPDPAAALARAQAEARQALAAVLTPGSWFKVLDPLHDAQRWLKVHSYNPPHDVVLFADFLGTNHLRLRASCFSADLVAGRSEPVDPSPTARRALKLLAPLAEGAPPAGEGAAWVAAAHQAPPR